MKRADYYRPAGKQTRLLRTWNRWVNLLRSLLGFVQIYDTTALLETTVCELRKALGLYPGETVDTVIVLGTGWGDAFPFDATRTVALTDLAGFEGLDELPGHERRFEIGTTVLPDGTHKRVIIQRGRIHMNEDTFNPDVHIMARLQTEVLIRLGAKKFILTAAVGGLLPELKPGDIVVVDSFPSWGNEVLPNWPGAFNEPANALDTDVIERFAASHVTGGDESPRLVIGSYVFFRGSHFEDRKHDKPRMRSIGGVVVGMSCKPECAVIMEHPDVKATVVCCVSNDDKEKPNHEKHRANLQAQAKHLAGVIGLTLSLQAA
ncbi:MAG: hypothetical protein HQ488_05220 [Parcubacteria group bacterium]|nr:hypothetical protein [Parcubacteria group bacterium]